MGYHRAGFDVVGVDIKPQPRYPFKFIQADALAYLADCGGCYDAIHASPPCQGFSALKVMPTARYHPDLLTPVREILRELGKPYVIENVVGAPIEIKPVTLFESECGVLLCGSMFGLRANGYELRRHRLFESSVWLPQPTCQHKDPVIGFYGDHARTRQRTIAGNRNRGGDITGVAQKLALVRDLMGIDWMSWTESCQAIPPAYTEFIGLQLRQLIEALV